MKTIYLVTASAVALLAGNAAHAADWSGGGSPAVNWTGAYIGANIGYNIGNSKTDYSYVSSPAIDPPGFEDVFGPAGYPDNFNLDGVTSAVDTALGEGFIPGSLGSDNKGSFAAGGQIGYDKQYGQTVLGVLADFDWVGGTHTTTFTAPDDFDGLTNDSSETAGVRWLSTVRGRIGLPIQNALLFATGGLAFGDTVAKSSALVSDGTNDDTYAGSKSGVRAGFAVGGGVAFQLNPKLTLTGEYLYYNLGSATYAVNPTNDVAEGEGLAISGHTKFDGSLLRVSLNYKFGN